MISARVRISIVVSAELAISFARWLIAARSAFSSRSAGPSSPRHCRPAGSGRSPPARCATSTSYSARSQVLVVSARVGRPGDLLCALRDLQFTLGTQPVLEVGPGARRSRDLGSTLLDLQLDDGADPVVEIGARAIGSRDLRCASPRDGLIGPAGRHLFGRRFLEPPGARSGARGRVDQLRDGSRRAPRGRRFAARLLPSIEQPFREVDRAVECRDRVTSRDSGRYSEPQLPGRSQTGNPSA